MKVKVTKQDIEEGKTRARYQCGCPIHRALGRTLNIRIDLCEHSNNTLLVPKWQKASLGNIRIPLPRKAVAFQKKLAADPNADVQPFEFETKLLGPK